MDPKPHPTAKTIDNGSHTDGIALADVSLGHTRCVGAPMKQISEKPPRRQFVGLDTIVDQRSGDSMGVTAGIFVVVLLLVLTFFASNQRKEVETAKLQQSIIEESQPVLDEDTVAISAPENPEDSLSPGDQIIESLDPLYPPAD
jgi:hypothetical protein